MAVAFAIAIALHEAAAGLVPPNLATPPQHPEIVSRAKILHVSLRPTPMATPTQPPLPTPTPVVATPRPVATTHIIIPPSAQGRAGARPAAQPPPHISTEKPALSIPNPAAAVAGAQATGSNGFGVTTAMSSGGNGSGASGSGIGSGASGYGNGAASGDEPCGFVTFSDPHGSHYDPHTRGFWVDIRMLVHFADGSSQSMILDYPWYYPNEASNPWSDQNLKDPNFPTRFQRPSSEKLGNEPSLVQYVVSHSTPDGMTLLRDCPQPSPTPAL